MYIIAGLGNPGKEYEETRHNAGFLFLDSFLEGKTIFQNKSSYEIAELKIRKFNLALVKPMKYMNLSGEVIKKLCDKIKHENNDFNIPEHLIIAHDDVDLEPGAIKIKNSGGDGGHRGIRNTIECLGSDQFIRIRIGIGKHPFNTSGYVLDKFSKQELSLLQEDTFKRASRFINEYLNIGYQKAVSRVGLTL